jgi:hypothetical protein
MPASEDAWLASVVAALLATGSRIDLLSRLLTAAALIALLLLPASFGLPAGLPTAVIAAVALVGLLEMHFALRVRFDAALFAQLAEDSDLAGLDRALLALRLMPASKTGRPTGERARGALRLLYRQALCLAAQAALILVGAGVAVFEGGK